MNISAVIITLNEERDIGRCLASVANVVDEMVVLDSGSQDRTVEICKQFGATVINQEWLGYAATKNKGNELAAHDHILSLDADEALSEQLQRSILLEKSELKNAYSFNRMNNYCGTWIKHGGFYPDKKIRLFNRHKARWGGGKVHESLQVDPEVNIIHLEGDLLHFSFYTVAEHRQKVEKYARLAAPDLTDKSALRIRSYLHAAWRFVQSYFIKAGFLDGHHGFQICKQTAMEVRLKYEMAAEQKGKNP